MLGQEAAEPWTGNGFETHRGCMFSPHKELRSIAPSSSQNLGAPHQGAEGSSPCRPLHYALLPLQPAASDSSRPPPGELPLQTPRCPSDFAKDHGDGFKRSTETPIFCESFSYSSSRLGATTRSSSSAAKPAPESRFSREVVRNATWCTPQLALQGLWTDLKERLF